MSDAPAITPTPTPTETTPAPASWLSSITDAEIVGHAQTKGWDKLDAAAAFQEAVKAHRGAERLIGAPADKLVRLPNSQDDEAGWKAVWAKLGAPDKPEGYELTGLELDDPELTAKFHNAIRSAAAELNMPKAMAERMAQQFHKFVSDAGAADSAEQAAALQTEQQKLTQDWGKADESRFKANMFIADRAFENLGVTPQQMAKLKDGLGAAEVAKLFHKIGIAMGEAKYVSGENPASGGIMSRDQAVARKSELMGDTQWRERYLKGGSAEMREMTALNTLIVGA